MPTTVLSNQVSAAAYLTYAREYHEAAEILFRVDPRLTRVLKQNYFHSVELLLKAYLRAHSRDPWGHNIEELYRECRDLGLVVEADDRFGLGNVVGLLQSGNHDMAYRYFTLDSTIEADLRWTREVVGQLMGVVRAFVEPNGPATKPGPPVKTTLLWGKPQPK